MMEGIKFAQPEFFWLLLIIPVMIGFYIYFVTKRSAQLKFSSFENLK